MFRFAMISALALTAFAIAPVPSAAQDAVPATAEQLARNELAMCFSQKESVLVSGNFTKKRYNISGHWNLLTNCDGQTLSFENDFKTKSGPDLKVYLSKSSLAELDSSGVETSSLKIGVLKSNRGLQSYDIPNDIDLSEYKSVVIHCEAFTVLWGGFDLPET